MNTMADVISVSSDGMEVPVLVMPLTSCVVMHVKHEVHINDLE
jgi:hypothetical protein